MRVECRTCHRREHWDGSDRTIEQAGGSRRSPEHPQLASWHTLRAASQAGRRVVAECVCGQPMLSTEGTPIPWVLQTPEGPVTVSDGIVGPLGPLSEDDTEALMMRHYRERFRFRPVLALFQGTVMLSVVAPMLLWIAAVATVILVLSGLVRQPGF